MPSVVLVKYSDTCYYVLSVNKDYGINLYSDNVLVSERSIINSPNIVSRKTLPSVKEIRYDGVLITEEEYNSKLSSFYAVVDDIRSFLYKGALQDYEEYMSKIKIEYVSKYDEIALAENDVKIRDVTNIISEKDSAYVSYITDVGRNLGLCRFDTHKFAKDVFFDLCAFYKIKNYDLPNHSGLRFAKANGDYIFDGSFEFQEKICTLEQFKETKERVYDKIKEYMHKKCSKKIQADNIAIQDFISTLEKINNMVTKIEVHKKEYTSKVVLKNFINENIKNLSNLLEE